MTVLLPGFKLAHSLDLIMYLFSYLTCLHAAVLSDNQDIVKLLLRRGAVVNKADKEGVTPLALAIRWVVSTLIGRRVTYFL